MESSLDILFWEIQCVHEHWQFCRLVMPLLTKRKSSNLQETHTLQKQVHPASYQVCEMHLGTKLRESHLSKHILDPYLLYGYNSSEGGEAIFNKK